MSFLLPSFPAQHLVHFGFKSILVYGGKSDFVCIWVSLRTYLTFVQTNKQTKRNRDALATQSTPWLLRVWRECLDFFKEVLGTIQKVLYLLPTYLHWSLRAATEGPGCPGVPCWPDPYQLTPWKCPAFCGAGHPGCCYGDLSFGLAPQTKGRGGKNALVYC